MFPGCGDRPSGGVGALSRKGKKLDQPKETDAEKSEGRRTGRGGREYLTRQERALITENEDQRKMTPT